MNEWQETLKNLLAMPALRAALIVVASVVLAKLVDFLISRVLLRLALRTDTDLDEKVAALLHRPVFISVVLVGLYLGVKILEIDPGLQGLVVTVIKTIALLLWTATGLRLCHTLIAGLGRLADRVQWLETRTVPLFDNLAKILLVGGAIYFLMIIWGFDAKPWLASAGIIGIALGFAAKDTLANLFGGLFIIVDAPYKISVEQVLEDPAPRIRFTELGDSALIFRVLCWIAEPVQRGATIDALNTAVYKSLMAEGISIPFPQREVHLRQAPPL